MEPCTALYVNTLMQVGYRFFSKTLRICYYFPRHTVVCGFQTYPMQHAVISTRSDNVIVLYQSFIAS